MVKCTIVNVLSCQSHWYQAFQGKWLVTRYSKALQAIRMKFISSGKA
jgi:hypothetical protein